MPRRIRPDQRKLVLIAAAAWMAYGRDSAIGAKRKTAAPSGWSIKSRLEFWGPGEESVGR